MLKKGRWLLTSVRHGMNMKSIILIVVVILVVACACFVSTYGHNGSVWIQAHGTEMATYAEAVFSGQVIALPKSIEPKRFSVGNEQVCVELGRNFWFSRGVAYSRAGVRPITWVAKGERYVTQWKRIDDHWYEWIARP
jgi:hypothetical protein